MDKWIGRIAVVTGASAGIGAEIAKALVQEGMIVIGLARREDRLQEIAKELKNASGKLIAKKVDLRNENEIIETFNWIKENYKRIDVLINNAGLVGVAPLKDGVTEKWRNILEVNVLALSICTREAVQAMFASNVDDGYIININSIAGHYHLVYEGLAMYVASKHSVTVLTDALRRELTAKKSHIKVSSISPGMVETEIFEAGNLPRPAEAPALLSKDISDQVIHLLKTPPSVHISELIIVPTLQLF